MVKEATAHALDYNVAIQLASYVWLSISHVASTYPITVVLPVKLVFICIATPTLVI